MWLRRLAVPLALVALAGCGSDDAPAPGARSDLLVDFEQKPPYVNALEIDPETREFLLSTNRGFYRVDPAGKRATKVRSTVRGGTATSPVGTFLELEVQPDGTYIGSGHPDDPRRLPQFLGFMASDDDGRTWQVLSRLGDADLHKIVVKHDRIYAWDAVLSAMVESGDGGRTFEENFTPRGVIIDFEVDPEDPERIIIANDDELYRSEDGGARWRPLTPARRARFAWPAEDRLYRATEDGTFEVSDDGGTSFTEQGRIPGEPYKLKAVGPDELYAAVSDGGILRTTDGGRSWTRVFTPRA